MKTAKQLVSVLLLSIMMVTIALPTSYARTYNEHFTEEGNYTWSYSSSNASASKKVKPGQQGGTLRTYVHRNGNTKNCSMSFRWDSPTIGINRISWTKIQIKSNDGKTIYKTIGAGSKSFNTSKNVTVPLNKASQVIKIPTNVNYCLVYVQNASFYMMYGGPYTGSAPANTLNIRVKIN